MLFDKGRAYLERGNVPMALPALQQANRLQPGHAELLILLGLAYDQAERPVQALEALEEAHRLRPSDGDLNNNVGVARLRVYTVTCPTPTQPGCQPLLEQAETAFQTALQDPALHAPEGVWFNLALLHKQRGQEGPMLAALDRALAINSHHLPAQLAMAEHYRLVGHIDRERQYLRNALAAYPDQVVVLERLVASFLGASAADNAPSAGASQRTGHIPSPAPLSPEERAEVRSWLTRILSLAPGTEAAQRASQRVLLLDGK